MATTRSFNAMLNQYLAYDLLMEELEERTFFINKVEKDNNWKGGDLQVPFKGANASSYSYGALTADTDIAENQYVRGSVSGYKEIWGTMKWNGRDLDEHGGGGDGVSEQSFLKNLPDQIEDFIVGMKEVVSVNLLTGDHFAKRATPLTGVTDDDVNGLISVDRPERFTLGQKVAIKDGNTAVTSGYVGGIDINKRQILLWTTRAGSTALDVSAYTVAQTAKLYVPGASTASTAFTSLKDQLLSLANGGSTNLFGVAKTAYPYLQAINLSGADITASNFLDKLFDNWTTCKILGKGNATDAVMSLKHLGSAMKLLEMQSGPYKNVEMKVTAYGWTEIKIQGVKGVLSLVGVHEMDDDVIFLIDWKAMKLHSNKFFQKQTSPEGLGYYTIRATTGYTYIADIKFYGELVVSKPSACGIIHTISY